MDRLGEYAAVSFLLIHRLELPNVCHLPILVFRYGLSRSSSRPARSSEGADPPGAGKRKLRIGKSGKMFSAGGAKAEAEGERVRPSMGEDRQHNQVGSLAKGCAVVLVGLQGATHHNGKSGTVDGFLEEKSRYVVKLSGTGEKLALKLENLSIQSA